MGAVTCRDGAHSFFKASPSPVARSSDIGRYVPPDDGGPKKTPRHAPWVRGQVSRRSGEALRRAYIRSSRIKTSAARINKGNPFTGLPFMAQSMAHMFVLRGAGGQIPTHGARSGRPPAPRAQQLSSHCLNVSPSRLQDVQGHLLSVGRRPGVLGPRAGCHQWAGRSCR